MKDKVVTQRRRAVSHDLYRYACQALENVEGRIDDVFGRRTNKYLDRDGKPDLAAFRWIFGFGHNS
jgi:hypothetical protein